jgi:hypothetical protein
VCGFRGLDHQATGGSDVHGDLDVIAGELLCKDAQLLSSVGSQFIEEVEGRRNAEATDSGRG